MKLSSSAFTHNGKIPRKYTCQGVDINPPLEISEMPEKTVSLALLLEDPDVPERVRKDGLWIHWVVFNMDPKMRTLAEGVPTPGTLGSNTEEMSRYMGPCPPDREHRYFFKLYALDCRLPLKEGATRDQVLQAMEGHILASTELMGRYVRE